MIGYVDGSGGGRRRVVSRAVISAVSPGRAVAAESVVRDVDSR